VATTGKVLYGRQKGHHLTEEARAATKELADRLSHADCQAVYCSPLERTIETATLLAAPHGLSPVVYERVIEVDYGEWTGQKLAKLYKLPEWRTVAFQPSRMRFPGGESLAEAQLRGTSACEALAGRHPDGTIAIVTHADIIRLVLASYLGQPLDLLSRLTVAPASVSVLDISKKGAVTIVAVNTNGDTSTWQ
jgi:probable phosphoglycerate mutase